MKNSPIFFILRAFSAFFELLDTVIITPNKEAHFRQKCVWYIVWYIGAKRTYREMVEVIRQTDENIFIRLFVSGVIRRTKLWQA